MSNISGNEERGRGYRVLVILLITLAVLSSAKKDINRLAEAASGLEEFVTRWTSVSVVSASAAEVSPNESFCADVVKQNPDSQQFRWSGHLAPGKAIEIRGLHGDIAADLSPSDQVEVVANKEGRESEANSVTIKVVEHANGVTICAVYPTDDPTRTTPCVPGRSMVPPVEHDTSAKVNVRNNGVQVNFRVRVPAGVDFLARTVNGEISATSLASNVMTRTVNGSIRISTSGYAEAKTVNGEISARLGNANWLGALEFKTVNGEINLDLPALTSTTIQAKTFNGEVSSDFPITVVGKFNRREMSGTIGTGGRELILKTLNGSINLRRAG
jgi:Toastrack DUF4097